MFPLHAQNLVMWRVMLAILEKRSALALPVLAACVHCTNSVSMHLLCFEYSVGCSYQVKCKASTAGPLHVMFCLQPVSARQPDKLRAMPMHLSVAWARQAHASCIHHADHNTNM